MTEDWRAVPGWEGLYEASTFGRVRSIGRHVPVRGNGKAFRPGRVLALAAKAGRYLAVTLTNGEVRPQMLVHDVIAATFHGPKPLGLHVRHLDGNHTNNTPGNLQYGTARENEADKRQHGRSLTGERHHSATLTEQNVRDIRASTDSNKDVAARFGISASHCWQIRQRKAWKHI